MKTVYIVQGSWANRYMRLDEATADAALSDGWARENEGLTDKERKEADARAKTGELPPSNDPDDWPQSLQDWEDSLEEEPGAEEREPRRRSTRGRRKE